VLAGERTLEQCGPSGGPDPRGRASIDAVTPHLRQFWTI
jgi:hypothetical protein